MDEAFAAILAVVAFLLAWWIVALAVYVFAMSEVMRPHPLVGFILIFPVAFLGGAAMGVVAARRVYRQMLRPATPAFGPSGGSSGRALAVLRPTRSPIVLGLRYLDRKIGLGTIAILLCLLQIPWAVANFMMLLALAPPKGPGLPPPISPEAHFDLSVLYVAPAIFAVVAGLIAGLGSSFRAQKNLGVLAMVVGAGIICAFSKILGSL